MWQLWLSSPALRSCIIVRYSFSEDCLTQSNPLCTSIISSNQITRAHPNDIIIKNVHFLIEEHMLADLSSMMSSELRHHCTHISLF